MIVTTLIAATTAVAQPAPVAQPAAAAPIAAQHATALAPMADKKMACCDAMAKGEGCCCCKDKATAKAGSPDDHSSHSGHSR